MPSAAEITEQLKASFPDGEVRVRDLTGTGDHFEAQVVSSRFANRDMSAQHELVYQALERWISSNSLHALALTTRAGGQSAR
jgi:stress-induced morphogen